MHIFAVATWSRAASLVVNGELRYIFVFRNMSSLFSAPEYTLHSTHYGGLFYHSQSAAGQWRLTFFYLLTDTPHPGWLYSIVY